MSVYQKTTHSDIGRTSIREGRDGYRIVKHSNGTSIERPEVGRVGMLPVIPDLVDHLRE